jgi:hypothetical protein
MKKMERGALEIKPVKDNDELKCKMASEILIFLLNYTEFVD